MAGGIPQEAQQRIDVYLAGLRARLRGVNDHEAREFVEEIRSHLLDKVAPEGQVSPASVEEALAALGSPDELARQYLTEAVLVRVQASRSPLRILENLFRWARLSVAGFFVLLAAIVGYFLGGALVVCALLKPFHPQSAGLWAFHDATGDVEYSLRMGFSTPPAGGHELLGWWMVPIGLVAGGLLLMLTTAFALWCARRFRRPRISPAG